MNRNRLIFAIVAASSALAIAACGGVDSDLIGGNSDGGDDSDGASSGRVDAGRDGSSGSRDSGSGGDAGSGGGSDGGGVTVDSGHPKKDGGLINLVQCGTNGTTTGTGTVVTCNATDPVCCASQYPYDTTPQSYSCTANNASCVALDAGSIPMECRDNADCPGSTQCCGHESANNDPLNPLYFYDSVRCSAVCPLQFPDAGETLYRLFCNPSGPSVCTIPGESCVASTLLPGFNVCGTP